MKEQILVLSTPDIAKHIDFMEANEEGIYVYFKDKTVEFHAWKNMEKLNDGEHRDTEEV